MFIKWVHPESESELVDRFSRHGRIASAPSFVPRIEACFLQFMDAASALRARAAEDGKPIGGRTISESPIAGKCSSPIPHNSGLLSGSTTTVDR